MQAIQWLVEFLALSLPNCQKAFEPTNGKIPGLYALFQVLMAGSHHFKGIDQWWIDDNSGNPHCLNNRFILWLTKTNMKSGGELTTCSACKCPGCPKVRRWLNTGVEKQKCLLNSDYYSKVKGNDGFGKRGPGKKCGWLRQGLLQRRLHKT